MMARENGKADDAAVTTSMTGLAEDLLGLIFGVIVEAKDIAALYACRATCKTLAPLAKESLARIPSAERIRLLLDGQLPRGDTSVLVERQAAAWVVDGKISRDISDEVFRYANSAAVASSGWILGNCLQSPDPHGDLTFPLRGIDQAPLAERSEVTAWYAAQYPERQLRLLHLPCILGGPPRYLALAGSDHQKRQIRKIPLELCRIVRRPAGDSGFSGLHPGKTLIEELLRLAGHATVTATEA